MSTPTVRIAIDPGKAGGIAVRYPAGGLALYAMPTTESDVAALLLEILTAVRVEGWAIEAVLERVGGFVGCGQPGSAMFTFGRGVGILVGLLMAHRVPFREVRPQDWQKAIGAGTTNGRTKGEWKRCLLDLSRKRHPGVAGLTLKTCDALLLLTATEPSLSPVACAVGISHQ